MNVIDRPDRMTTHTHILSKVTMVTECGYYGYRVWLLWLRILSLTYMYHSVIKDSAEVVEELSLSSMSVGHDEGDHCLAHWPPGGGVRGRPPGGAGGGGVGALEEGHLGGKGRGGGGTAVYCKTTVNN